MLTELSEYIESLRQDDDGNYIAVLKPEYAVDGTKTIRTDAKGFRGGKWITVNGNHILVGGGGRVLMGGGWIPGGRIKRRANLRKQKAGVSGGNIGLETARKKDFRQGIAAGAGASSDEERAEILKPYIKKLNWFDKKHSEHSDNPRTTSNVDVKYLNKVRETGSLGVRGNRIMEETSKIYRQKLREGVPADVAKRTSGILDPKMPKKNYVSSRMGATDDEREKRKMEMFDEYHQTPPQDKKAKAESMSKEMKQLDKDVRARWRSEADQGDTHLGAKNIAYLRERRAEKANRAANMANVEAKAELTRKAVETDRKIKSLTSKQQGQSEAKTLANDTINKSVDNIGSQGTIKSYKTNKTFSLKTKPAEDASIPKQIGNRHKGELAMEIYETDKNGRKIGLTNYMWAKDKAGAKERLTREFHYQEGQMNSILNKEGKTLGRLEREKANLPNVPQRTNLKPASGSGSIKPITKSEAKQKVAERKAKAAERRSENEIKLAEKVANTNKKSKTHYENVKKHQQAEESRSHISELNQRAIVSAHEPHARGRDVMENIAVEKGMTITNQKTGEKYNAKMKQGKGRYTWTAKSESTGKTKQGWGKTLHDASMSMGNATGTRSSDYRAAREKGEARVATAKRNYTENQKVRSSIANAKPATGTGRETNSPVASRQFNKIRASKREAANRAEAIEKTNNLLNAKGMLNKTGSVKRNTSTMKKAEGTSNRRFTTGDRVREAARNAKAKARTVENVKEMQDINKLAYEMGKERRSPEAEKRAKDYYRQQTASTNKTISEAEKNYSQAQKSYQNALNLQRRANRALGR